MSFSDPFFLFLFLPFSLVLFNIAFRFAGQDGAISALVACTLLFVSTYGLAFLMSVLAITFFNALLYYVIYNTDRAKRLRTFVFSFGIIINIGILFAIKASLFDYIIPITLSFIIFQRIVTLLHAYSINSQDDFFVANNRLWLLRFFGATLSFPNILIGPITYLTELSPQFASKEFGKLRAIDISIGGTLLVIGLAKKFLLADPLNVVISPVFDIASFGNTLPPVEVALSMCAYTFFLYLDFSAYSDMALGIARLFSIRLPINFNSPLRSTSIGDFWKRWHISLTRVIATSLFTPLSLAGTRFSIERKLKGWRARIFQSWLPFLFNFEVIALWHGLTWNFVLFGFFHATLFVVDNEIRRTRFWTRYVIKLPDLLRLRLGQIFTFALVTISLALVRSDSIQSFFHIMTSLTGNWYMSLSPADRVLSGYGTLKVMLPAAIVILFAPNAYEFLKRYRPGIMTYSVPSSTPQIFAGVYWRPTLIWAVLAAACAIWVFAGLNAPQPFVYGGF